MRFFHRVDEEDRFFFAPLGGETATRLGIENGETMVLLKQGECYEKSEAVRMAVAEIWPPLAWLMALISVNFRDRCYDFIAARRYRFFKAGSVCKIPDEELRDKILS